MSKKNLLIEETEAKQLYKTADSNFKQILETTFGKVFFYDKITDRIKTWEDVVNYYYNKCGININMNIPYSINTLCGSLSKQQKSINALYKIQCISKVLNEDWKEDWLNNWQYKYLPYFEKSASGGWVVSGVAAWATYSHSGFGSYFKSKELAIYAGKQFIEIYKDYLPE